MTTSAIQFKPHRLAVFLGSIVCCLVAANTLGLVSTYVFGHGRLLGVIPLFDLSEESNIPTFFATTLLLLCSGLLVLGGMLNKRRGDLYHRYWKALGGVFLYLAIDEAAALHEKLTEPVRTAFHTSGLLYFAWVIPYGIAVVLLLIIFLRFIAQLPTHTRRLTLLAGFVYVAGGMGIESIGGYYFELAGKSDLIFDLLSMGEESLEMIGLVIFVYTLTSYIVSTFDRLLIQTMPLNAKASLDEGIRGSS